MPPTTAKRDIQIAADPDCKRRGSIVETVKSPPPTKASVTANESTEGSTASDSIFKSDLTHIRNLVTCSICDQLLYEPFTIQCGHTYCYSCLCNWFTPNKNNKTCPECRTAVKQSPAPSFMIKQLVEVFTQRSELMPPDESVGQHNTKRAEELAAVEEDRSSDRGLFKGLFSARSAVLDEADGVHRCPTCHTEYIGGPTCRTCGTEIDGDNFDFSADDFDFDLDALDDDLELEDELEFELREQGNRGRNMLDHPAYMQFQRHVRFGGRRDRNHESTPSVTSDSDDIHGEVHTDSEEEGSLQDFVVNDDSPISRRDATPSGRRLSPDSHLDTSPYDGISSDRRTIESDNSDEDSDEEIVQRAPRRRSPRRSQVVDLTEDDDDSDEEDVVNASTRLRDAGWSPLHGNDNDESDARDTETSDTSDDCNDLSSTNNDDSDGSDTETMIGNDDLHHRRSPSLDAATRRRYEDFWNPQGSDLSSNMDDDGDTEMSMSPTLHDRMRGDYGDLPQFGSSQASRQGTEEYADPFDGDPYATSGFRNLGHNLNVHEVDDDDSDDSPPRPIGRRWQRNTAIRNGRDYDPRISQIFASHQNLRQGSHESERQSTGLEELDPALSESSEGGRVEYYSENNRSSSQSSRPRIVRYNQALGTRSSRHRNTTTSPGPRIISSSSRPSRIERRYHVDLRGPRAGNHWQ